MSAMKWKKMIESFNNTRFVGRERPKSGTSSVYVFQAPTSTAKYILKEAQKMYPKNDVEMNARRKIDKFSQEFEIFLHLGEQLFATVVTELAEISKCLTGAWPSKVEKGGLRAALGLDEDKPLEEQTSPSAVAKFFKGADKEGRGMVMFAVNSNQDQAFWKKVGDMIKTKKSSVDSGLKSRWLELAGDLTNAISIHARKEGNNRVLSQINGVHKSLTKLIKEL